MDACLTPALLESSAPVFMMVPGSVENAPLATVVMELSVKTLMRYDKTPSSFDGLSDCLWRLNSTISPKNSAKRYLILASSLMVYTAARTRTLATTVYRALLGTQDPNRMVKVLSKLLQRSR